jgi:hypothetical protein
MRKSYHRGARALPSLAAALLSLALLSACDMNMASGAMLDRAKDLTPPKLLLSSPTEGDACANIVEVRGSVSDIAANGAKGEVASLAYQVPGSAVGGQVEIAANGDFAFQFLTETLGGSFLLSLEAKDWNSNSASASLNLQKAIGDGIPSFSVSVSNKRAVLSWDPVPGTASYTLYYSDNGSLPSESVGTKRTNVSSGLSLPCVNGNLYIFRLKANASDGVHDSLSDYSRAIPLSDRSLVPRLYGLRGKIKLEWNGIAATDEFTIYRRVGELGTFDEFRSVSGTEFTDATVQNGSRYYYKIKPKSDSPILSEASGGQTDGFMTSPTVGKYAALGDARDIYWSGDFLYATSYTKGLMIFNAKDQARPAKIATMPMPGGKAYQTIVKGDYAYVAAGLDGLRIYNVSLPSAPSLCASLTTGIACARGLAFYGEGTILVSDFSYAADTDTNTNNGGWSAFYDHTIKAVDISTPLSPSLVKTLVVDSPADRVQYGYLNPSGSHIDIAVSGDYACVADQGSGLKILNLTDPDGSPAIATVKASNINVSYGDSAAFVSSVTVAGGYAYAAVDYCGMMVVDVRDPPNPIALSCQASTNGRIWDLAASGDWLFTANLALGVQVYRLDDPAVPALQKNIPVSYPVQIAVKGALAFTYVENGSYEQYIVDMNIPLDISVLSIADATGGACIDVAIEGSHAYVAADSAGLRILDLSDPAAPRETASLATPDMCAASVRVSGELAFVWTNSVNIFSTIEQILIVDISDPSAPLVLKTINTNYVRGLAVSGSYLYVCSYDKGFQVFDISDPAMASEIKRVAMAPTVHGMSISGNYAYVTEDDQGVLVMDITDPTNAFYSSSIALGEAINICASETGIFVESYLNGIGVGDISDPLSPEPLKLFPPESEFGKGIAQAGNFVFASHYANGPAAQNIIKILDVSKIGAPRLIASYDAAFDTVLKNANGNNYTYANGLAVSGPYLYSAVGNKGLYVYKLRP